MFQAPLPAARGGQQPYTRRLVGASLQSLPPALVTLCSVSYKGTLIGIGVHADPA